MEAAILGIRKRNEENLPAKKRRTDPDVHRFNEGVKPQQKAFDYSDDIDGVTFAEDYGNAKQYLVSRNHDDMYDFVFQHAEDKRNFYEMAREDRLVKCFVDLELYPKNLHDGEELFATMDAIQEEIIRVILDKLAVHGCELDDCLVLHSDGAQKGSRHIIFDAYFPNIRPSLHAFMMQEIEPALQGDLFNDPKSKGNKRGFDATVYTRNRPFRLLGCTKRGAQRWLHILNRSNKPFTPEHRADFMRSLLQEPKPGCTVINYEPPVRNISHIPRAVTASEPKSTVLDSISESHIAAIQKQVEAQVPETKSCKEPNIKQEMHEFFGPSLHFSYAPGSAGRECLHGGTHDSNTLKLFIDLLEGTVRYYCHGTHKKGTPDFITLEPIKTALRLRSAFNDHTQPNKCDEDHLQWRLKQIAFKQAPLQAKVLDHRNAWQRDQQVAKTEYMKKVIPLINQCFAMVHDTKTLVVQRCVSHGIGQTEVISYKYRDLKTMKEQFDWTISLKEYRILDHSPENFKRIEYDVKVAPIVEWLKSERRLTFRERVFNPRPYGTAKCATADQLNMFTGIDYPMTQELTKEEMKEAEDGPLKPFIDHIKYIWSANAPDAFPWVMMFLAITVARPWVKVKVALVLKSLPRAGKGVVMVILEKILGKKYVSLPGSVEDVTVKQFNSQFTEHCLLMGLDEAFWGGSKRTKGLIKKMVTEGYTNVERKFVDGYRSEACWNTIFASNEKHVVNMDIASGKMVALDVSNKWAGVSSDPKAKKEYMEAILDTDVQLLSNYFHSMDFDSWNPYDLPLTHASMDQMIRSLSPEHEFILQILNNPTIAMGHDANVLIDSETVFDGKSLDRGAMYALYCRNSRSRTVSQKMFWKEWKHCIPETEMPNRVVRNRINQPTRCMLLPPIERARDSFRRAVHMPDLKFEKFIF